VRRERAREAEIAALERLGIRTLALVVIVYFRLLSLYATI